MRLRATHVKATLGGLSLAARASSEARGVGRPGLRNADIELNANESGGQARVALNGGALEFPGVFEEPLAAARQASRAQLAWRITARAARRHSPSSSR